LYKDSLKAFYDQGRILAWGIVPTSDTQDIEREDASSLAQRWQEQTAVMEGIGIERDQILAQSLITPSCGTGSLGLDHATKVLKMTHDVSRDLRGSL
jgi:hypothetical protein